ncbi:hypothetical protein L798_13798 [Zootermopsis nevadensis]|uniref:Uncharacterized protein n=1 Tax=Zootermopsis nevadensis TaxID=136037 RepID=A0A067QR45_ZOONE|nr:hypothetical protein L798_13798 [Zootermopsis nevadensis]
MEGLINVVGPIPKGFTDPATMQHLDSPNYMSPLFHLPHPTQPEPFRNQIQNSMMPLVSVAVKPSTSDTLPSSGVTSFKEDVNPFRRPYTQAFQQHYTFRHSENLPPQKYIQTIIATSNLPNEENVSKHEWQLHEQKKLVSDRFNIIPSLAQSSLTAATSSLPSMRNLPEFTEPHPFHFPPPNYLQRATLPHTSIVVQHSSPDDKTVLLPQTSPFQKFLSYTEQQLKQPGHQNENMASLSTRVPQPSTEEQSMPSLDATLHAAQSEYTTKLMEYFQQLQHE